MPLFGPPNIEKLKAKRDIKRLINGLRHSDEGVRRQAVEALAGVGDVRAVEGLIAFLTHESRRPGSYPSPEYWKWQERDEAACRALVMIGHPAVEPLIAALKDEHSSVAVQRAAARALGEIQDARAVEPLIAALGHHPHDVADALGKLGDARAVEPLIALLNADRDSTAASAAARALSKFDDDRAVEGLLLAQRADDTGVRMEVERALHQMGLHAIGHARSPDALIALLEHRFAHLRRAAAAGLGKLGDRRAVAPLIVALKDGDATVRAKAAEALGELRDPRAVEALVVTLVDDWDEVITASAIALGKMAKVITRTADRRPLDGLVRALRLIDEHRATAEDLFWNRADMRERSGVLNHEALDRELEAIRAKYREQRQVFRDALSRIGGADAQRALAEDRERHPRTKHRAVRN